MASTESISDAIQSIDVKKENLRKALEDLQSHSSLLSSFALQWKDLEEHFESIKKSIEARFEKLQSVETPSVNGSQPRDKQSSQVEKPAKKPNDSESVSMSMSMSMSHPAMKSFCVRMDGVGLRSYILNHRRELESIRNEIDVALRSAADPCKLVLDAMRGFYPPNSKGGKDNELAAIRRTCVLLLEHLMGVAPQIAPELKEEAKKLAFEWKGKVSTEDENPLEALSLMRLLATFGLGSEVNADELLDLAASVSRRKQTVDLCRALGLADKIPDLIEKLCSKGRQLDAIKFAYAFDLVDKFPPVPLLKAYYKHSKKVAQEVRSKGNHSLKAMNESTAKELAAVKAIIKCIEEHNLGSQYPRGNLDKRVEQLEKEKANRKRLATGPAPAPKKQKLQTGSRQPIEVPTAAIPQTYMQTSSSLLARLSPHMSSSVQYGMAGTSSAVARYMTSAAGSYGLGASSLSYGGMSPPRSHLYSFASHLTDASYDRSMGLGGQSFPPANNSLFYR